MSYYRIYPFIYLAVLSFSLAFFFTSWLGYHYSSEMPEITQTSSLSVRQQARHSIDYATILDRDIFALEKTRVIQAVVPYASAHGSSLKGFRLLGLIKGDKCSYALVSWHGDMLLLKKGIDVKGFKLIDVALNEVHIEYNMKIYTFKLESQNIPSAGSIVKTSRSTSSVQVRVNSNHPTTIKTFISKKEIAKECSNINEIIKSAFIEPYYLNGNLLGYRLKFIRPGAFLFRLGLRPGDIIVRINGHKLDNPQVLFNLFSSVDDLTSVTVDFIRDGMRRTLLVTVQ